MIGTISRFQALKIVRDYGYSPAQIRICINHMRRRGIGWKKARRAAHSASATVAEMLYLQEHN